MTLYIPQFDNALILREISFGWFQKVKNCCFKNFEGCSNAKNGCLWGFKMAKIDFALNRSSRKIAKFPHVHIVYSQLGCPGLYSSSEWFTYCHFTHFLFVYSAHLDIAFSTLLVNTLLNHWKTSKWLYLKNGVCRLDGLWPSFQFWSSLLAFYSMWFGKAEEFLLKWYVWKWHAVHIISWKNYRNGIILACELAGKLKHFEMSHFLPETVALDH